MLQSIYSVFLSMAAAVVEEDELPLPFYFPFVSLSSVSVPFPFTMLCSSRSVVLRHARLCYSSRSASVFPPLEEVREVRNQVYPLGDYDAFATDLPLR